MLKIKQIKRLLKEATEQGLNTYVSGGPITYSKRVIGVRGWKLGRVRMISLLTMTGQIDYTVEMELYNN